MSDKDQILQQPKPWWRRLPGGNLVGGRTVIPMVRLHGTIAADQRPGRINLATFEPVLKRAFKLKAPAVAITVNSPGGSPVQSRLIAKLIRDQAEEHDKKVLVFVEDAAASGGYFIASAGDEIIADPSSIVGSIGVIMATFGFDKAISKIGVSRRLYTAGKNKSTLDPFLPEKKEDVERIKQFEVEVHQVFIDYVKQRRGGKLKGTDDDLFTGEWWSGVRGLELGLVDALGDMHTVLRERYGADVKIKPVAPKKPLLQVPTFGLGASLDTVGLSADALATIEDKALWARFGL